MTTTDDITADAFATATVRSSYGISVTRAVTFDPWSVTTWEWSDNPERDPDPYVVTRAIHDEGFQPEDLEAIHRLVGWASREMISGAGGLPFTQTFVSGTIDGEPIVDIEMIGRMLVVAYRAAADYWSEGS